MERERQDQKTKSDITENIYTSGQIYTHRKQSQSWRRVRRCWKLDLCCRNKIETPKPDKKLNRTKNGKNTRDGEMDRGRQREKDDDRKKSVNKALSRTPTWNVLHVYINKIQTNPNPHHSFHNANEDTFVLMRYWYCLVCCVLSFSLSITDILPLHLSLSRSLTLFRIAQ